MSDDNKESGFKDFKEMLKKAEEDVEKGEFGQPKLDPTVHLSEPVQGEITLYQTMGAAVLSMFTAPLTTSYISLQLSVLKHRKIYTNTDQKQERALERISKEITPQQKRKYELLVKSGATEAQQPFRAAVYTSYKEVFQGLSRQGIQGFYKGNLLGLITQGFQAQFKYTLLMPFQFDQKFDNFYANTALSTAVLSVGDMMIQPLSLMQSRFILQNRLPNYATYKGLYAFIQKHKIPGTRREVYNGWQGNIPINLIRSLNLFFYMENKPLESFLIQYVLSNLMVYPVYTAKRRIECQSSHLGMIPKRYTGITHAMKLILKEEGFKGLYRGFFAFSIVQMVNIGIFVNSANTALLY